MTLNPDVLTAQRRTAVYWLTALFLVFGLTTLPASGWRGSVGLHTVMETAATLLAAVVGVMALVRYYSKKDNTFLFISTGFLGAAFLDGYHGLVTSEMLRPFMPSDFASLASWSWLSSRQFLAVMIFLSWLAWLRERRLGEESAIGERTVYLFAAGFTILSFLFFTNVPLPRAYYPEYYFHRPEEFTPALFFGLAMAGYLKKGRWREDTFEHWLVLSLLVNFIGQTMFMSRSDMLFDYQFDVAHLLKIAAYVCVLSGLMLNMLAIFRQAERGEARLRDAIASIQEGIALYDASDRLIIYNDEFLRLHTGLGDVIKPGMTFEEMIRAAVDRGFVVEAKGREEEFLEDRLRQHRNPIGPIVRELTDGTWYMISEARTPDGGIAVTETDITELMHAETALRESEARLRAIIDAVPAMISLKDTESRYLLINRRHREFFRLGDDIVGRTPTDLSLELGGKIAEIERQVVESGEVRPVYDFPWVDEEENHYDLLVMKAPLRELSGRVVGTVTASIDVTKQKTAERELKEREALTRRILEASPVGVLIATRDGEHLFANKQALDIQGVTREQLFRANAGEFYADPELRTRLKDQLYETGSTPPTEVELLRPDGSHYFVILSSTLTEFESRKAHLTYLYDVTPLKRTQEALKESEERTRAIVENVIDGIITIDERGTILSVNRAAEQIFGYPKHRMVGHNVSILAPEPHRSAHDRYIGDYLVTGNAKVIGKVREIEGVRASGQRFPIELAVNELNLGGERLFVGILRDITERKEMDRMKGEFVSTVSHELRTPLTSIRGSLGLLSGGAVGALSEAASELIDVAEKNTERLINLVNDILDMEKLDAGRMEFRFENIDLAETVKAAIEANEGYADEFQVTFKYSDPGADFPIRADSDRLTQVMSNLLSNAAKFSPPEDTVEITVTRRDGLGRVSVADHGDGVPEEFHDRLFSRFTQADSSDTRQTGGTGLGLNISKTIIDKHGGTIGFETERGAGATFYFELPLVKAVAGTSARAGRRRAKGRAS